MFPPVHYGGVGIRYVFPPVHYGGVGIRYVFPPVHYGGVGVLSRKICPPEDYYPRSKTFVRD